MDCSPSTWPSFQQFDDLPWMGLGDIDPLESLNKSIDNDCELDRSSSADPDETDAAFLEAGVSHDDTPTQAFHTKIDEFYRLASAESLAAARWESINAVDLAVVLDSFPCNNDTFTQCENGPYGLYSDSILSQEQSAFSGEVDAFMSVATPELAEEHNTMLHPDDKSSMLDDTCVISSDYASLSEVQDDVRCETSMVDDESPVSINLLQERTVNAVNSEMECKKHNAKYVTDGCGVKVGLLQPSHYFALPSITLHGCPNTLIGSKGARVTEESTSRSSPQQHDYIQPAMVVEQTPNCITHDYPAFFEQHLRMADAARATSELKRNQAQASRARRLASQRRAKKYPLQKLIQKYPLQNLIRMSSSSPSIRDKLGLGQATVPHGSPQLVSQNFANPMGFNSQLPTLLPLSLGGTPTQLPSCHELISQGNIMQGPATYQYGHPVAVLGEDSHASPSGRSMLQTQNGEDVHSLSSLPTQGVPNIPDPAHSLDAVLLSQLQCIISKMNVDVRLCIRDALHRLASSAKHRQSRTENFSGLDKNERQPQATETYTNYIDRWIVNMLFCKQPALFEDSSEENFAQATSRSMDNTNSSSTTQLWNSCASCVNLQEQPLQVFTGL